MMDISNNSKSFRASLTLKRASFNKKMNKLINTTPKSMRGRTNIPPPLNLDPLTPPPTVRQTKRQYDFLDSPFLGTVNPYNLDEEQEDEEMVDDSPTFQIKHNKTNNSQNKSFLKNVCCLCEEPLTNKLNGEKILELDCGHQSHYNCYLLLLNKDDINDFPSCCICDTKTKPIDENIVEELYSKTLVEESCEYDQEIIVEFPPQHDVITPYTPQGQIINNSNNLGFQSTTTKKSRFSLITSSSSLSSITPQYSIEDLIKPNFNIISEFNKISVTNNNEEITFGNVLNIFTSQLIEKNEDSFKEFKLKQEINDKIIKNFQTQIHDNKGINFINLSKLKLFDIVEISLDGTNWEIVQFYIFTNILLLLNEEGDSIIGTIMIKDHYTNLVKLNEHTLMLYFKTVTLPELQIRSLNKILISKWEDFFTNKLMNEINIPLMQITTNAWGLIDDGSIEIPKEIIKFNELTSKGLELPFQLMKTILPKPQPLPISLIMIISLINSTQLSNEEYLSYLQKMIKTQLDSMSNIDRFGLVIIGRDGNRQMGKYGTFYGMVNSSWSGWYEIIIDLQVSQNIIISNNEFLKIGLKTTEKLISTIPDLNYKELEFKNIRKLMIITSGDGENDGDVLNEKYLDKIMIDYKFSIHQVVISDLNSQQDDVEMFNGFKQHYQYKFNRFPRFADLISKIPKFQQGLKRIMIPTLLIDLELVSNNFITISSIEQNGNMVPYNKDKFTLVINDIDDGFYKNLKFNITIDLIKFKTQYQIPYNQYIEIPILKYGSNTKNQGNLFSINLQIQEPNNLKMETLISPIDLKFDECEEFINIPLFPPLSSFKDSLYVKKEIELMILDTLKKSENGEGIDELISLIFGLIRGCSTNFINFYKDSKFNKFKNFNNYIDFLIKILNKLKIKNVEEFDTLKKDFGNCLKMDEFSDEFNY